MPDVVNTPDGNTSTPAESNFVQKVRSNAKYLRDCYGGGAYMHGSEAEALAKKLDECAEMIDSLDIAVLARSEIEEWPAVKRGGCSKCGMGPLRESCAYPEACEHPCRELALQLNQALLAQVQPNDKLLQEPDGYAVLLDDPKGNTPGGCGYWYVGAYRTEAVAKDVAERGKQGARVVPMYFAPTAQSAIERTEDVVEVAGLEEAARILLESVAANRAPVDDYERGWANALKHMAGVLRAAKGMEDGTYGGHGDDMAATDSEAKNAR